MTAVWCVFRNYAAHAVEIGGDITPRPLFFLKSPSSVVQADADGLAEFSLPDDEDLIHHEVEMVVRLGEDLNPTEVCIGIDVTNRTRQTEAKGKGWPWTEGKSFRDSAVLGTWAEWEAGEYEIQLSVNGEVCQHASSSQMVHDIDSLLATLTDWYALSPGDLVFTGTPEGVGPMVAGDLVEATLHAADGRLVSRLESTAR